MPNWAAAVRTNAWRSVSTTLRSGSLGRGSQPGQLMKLPFSALTGADGAGSVPTGGQEVMRFVLRATIITTMASAGLGTALPATAAAPPAPPAGGWAPAVSRCVRVRATVPVGSSPGAAAADPKTGAVYVTNSGSDTVSVISGRTNTVTATIPVAAGPGAVAVNPRTNTVYVTNYGSDTVSVISGRTNTVTATVPVGGGPAGVAVNPRTDTVYVTNSLDIHTQVSAINGRTNAVTAVITADGTGDEYPDVIAVNPKTNAFYWGDGQQGGLYGTGIGGSIGSFPPNGVAVDPKTDTIYATDVDYYHNILSVISGQTGTLTSDITLASDPFGVTVDPKTDTLYVTNANDGTVSVLNGKTNTVTATIPVGKSPLGVTANPKTGTVYVTNRGDNTVSVLASRRCRNHPGTDTARRG